VEIGLVTAFAELRTFLFSADVLGEIKEFALALLAPVDAVGGVLPLLGRVTLLLDEIAAPGLH